MITCEMESTPAGIDHVRWMDHPCGDDHVLDGVNPCGLTTCVGVGDELYHVDE